MLTGGLLVISTTEVRKGVNFSVDLDGFKVGVVLEGIPVATEGLEGGNSQLGRNVVHLLVLGEVLELVSTLYVCKYENNIMIMFDEWESTCRQVLLECRLGVSDK